MGGNSAVSYTHLDVYKRQTVLNGALDPLLIHGFGLQGAAAATVLSQGICLGFMVCYLRKKALFSFHAADWSGKELGTICLKSLPAAFQQSIPRCV